MNIALLHYFDVPELEAPLGEVVVELLAGLDCPEVLPEAAPLAASFMHLSFSMPIRCAHFVSLAPAAALPLAPVVVEVLDWLLVLPLAEDEGLVCELVLPEALELEGVALDWPEVLPLAEDEGLVCELVLPEALGVDDGVVCELVLVLPPAAAEPLAEVDGVACELVLPLAPVVAEPLVELVGALVLSPAEPRSRMQRSFSAPSMLSQLLLAMPAAALPDLPLVCALVLPDEVWANEALESARSAAAVALARTFTFIWMLLLRNGWSELQRGNTQAPCRSLGCACAEGSAAA